MLSLKTGLNPNNKASRWCLVLASLLIPLTGCQKLFHAQDAPLKGQTVTIAMTVPDTPPPTTKPLQQETEHPFPQKRPVDGSLDSRLLPAQAPASADPLTVRRSTGSDASRPLKPFRARIVKADTVLTGKTVAEDMLLRGTVLIKGSLVVAPQATLRIAPGTSILMAPAAGSEELPRIVIQGRIAAAGTLKQPILFGSAYSESAAGDWGGIILLNSEKKNSLDYCRVEGAQTGLEAHFSRFSGHGVTVTRSHAGIVLFDSETSLQGSSINRCDTGCRLSDSELDLRDSTVQENRLGISAQRSSFTLTNVKIATHSQEGVSSDQCRFRLSSSQFEKNRSGIKVTGGDGQIFFCRFYQNREYGAELAEVRIRINNSTFTQNTGVGVVLRNARGSVVGSAFSDNRGGNILNFGNEIFAALLNWWGSADEKSISAGIINRNPKDASALVSFVPFLKERPATVP